jgi:hypothetical protein
MLLVCGDLVKAVRRVAAVAVAHCWGVTVTTVLTWRKALGVSGDTEGAARLKIENTRRRFGPVKVRLRTADGRRVVSAGARRNMSAAAKRQGRTAPDRTSFDPWEDEGIRANPPALAAYLIGRPVFAIYGRRFRLGVTKKHRR